MRTYIIAEAGVNHNGSIELAKELIKVAKDAGADAVKFQTFKSENLVTRQAKQATYQVENLGESTSQLAMLKKLELSYEQFTELQLFCATQEIEFLSTPFDQESADFLIDHLMLEKIKVSSGEITNIPFLHHIATKGKQMIVSTGMATVEEIHQSLAFISYGLAHPQKPVDVSSVYAFYETPEAKAALQNYVTLLHCTTQYPAPVGSINLRAIHDMKNTFQLPIGFSDHSEGIHLSMVAVGMGAQVIEKHFTLDKSLDGPDHAASLTPSELKEMVSRIREVELALGDGIKRPNSIELQNRVPARRSLVAKKPIQAGEAFTKENLTVKRPGSGISPLYYWTYLGKTAEASYSEDDLIDE